MQHSIFRAICQVGIFMICAQAIIHFRPREVYEKYLKFLVSAMVLIQLFLPIGSLVWGKGGDGAAEGLEQFRRRMQVNMKEAEESAAAADAILEQMTLEEVRRRMEVQQEEGGEVPGGTNPQENGEVPGGRNSQEGDGISEGDNQRTDGGKEREGGTGKVRIELKVEPVEAVSIGKQGQ